MLFRKILVAISCFAFLITAQTVNAGQIGTSNEGGYKVYKYGNSDGKFQPVCGIKLQVGSQKVEMRAEAGEDAIQQVYFNPGETVTVNTFASNTADADILYSRLPGRGFEKGALNNYKEKADNNDIFSSRTDDARGGNDCTVSIKLLPNNISCNITSDKVPYVRNGKEYVDVTWTSSGASKIKVIRNFWGEKDQIISTNKSGQGRYEVSKNNGTSFIIEGDDGNGKTCRYVSQTHEVPDCRNGIDDSGDGKIDYKGKDPGCVNENDELEDKVSTDGLWCQITSNDYHVDSGQKFSLNWKSNGGSDASYQVYGKWGTNFPSKKLSANGSVTDSYSWSSILSPSVDWDKDITHKYRDYRLRVAKNGQVATCDVRVNVKPREGYSNTIKGTLPGGKVVDVTPTYIELGDKIKVSWGITNGDTRRQIWFHGLNSADWGNKEPWVTNSTKNQPPEWTAVQRENKSTHEGKNFVRLKASGSTWVTPPKTGSFRAVFRSFAATDPEGRYEESIRESSEVFYVVSKGGLTPECSISVNGKKQGNGSTVINKVGDTVKVVGSQERARVHRLRTIGYDSGWVTAGDGATRSKTFKVTKGGKTTIAYDVNGHPSPSHPKGETNSCRVTISTLENDPTASLTLNSGVSNITVNPGEKYTVRWTTTNSVATQVKKAGKVVSTSANNSTGATQTASKSEVNKDIAWTITAKNKDGKTVSAGPILVRVRTECADGRDNDGDGKSDRNDPGCWKDPTKPGTYDPTIEKEINPTATLTVDGGTKTIKVNPGEKYTVVWSTDHANKALVTALNKVNPTKYTNLDRTLSVTAVMSEKNKDIRWTLVAEDANGKKASVGPITVQVRTECNDKDDNDNDKRKDAQDAGCRKDPKDPTSPDDPDDNDEGGEPACVYIAYGTAGSCQLPPAPEVKIIVGNGCQSGTVAEKEEVTVRAKDKVDVCWDPNGYVTPGSGNNCTLAPSTYFSGANANAKGSIKISLEALTNLTYTCTDGGPKNFQLGTDSDPGKSSDKVKVNVLPVIFES